MSYAIAIAAGFDLGRDRVRTERYAGRSQDGPYNCARRSPVSPICFGCGESSFLAGRVCGVLLRWWAVTDRTADILWIRTTSGHSIPLGPRIDPNLLCGALGRLLRRRSR
jgi:hypothetical protein